MTKPNDLVILAAVGDDDELPQWAQTAIHFAAGVTVTCAAIAVIYTMTRIAAWMFGVIW